MSKLETIVFDAIHASLDRWGESSISMTELSQVTGYGRTSLSKAITLLKSSGQITVVRSKRNYGKLYKNKYRIVK